MILCSLQSHVWFEADRWGSEFIENHDIWDSKKLADARKHRWNLHAHRIIKNNFFDMIQSALESLCIGLSNAPKIIS